MRIGNRPWQRWSCALALVGLSLSTAAGCGGDDEEAKEPTGLGTSGGESPAGDKTGGGTKAGSTPKETASGSGDASSDDASGPSPWGSPLADQGTPLPPRKAMKPSAADDYRDGLDEAEKGNLDGAKKQFEDALEADPNAYEAAYNLGVIADRAGNENRAFEYYKRALRIQPDYEKAANGIVTIYGRRGQVQEALKFIEPLAKYWERNLALQAVYAETLVQANKVDEAVEAARNALRRDERFVPAMIAIVKASLKQGRKELAQTVLDQALSIDANNAEAQYLKGVMLLEQDGRLKDALDRFQKAVQLRSDYAEARMALGVQQLAGGNYPEALKNLEAAARLSPHLVAVHLNLGDAYRANKAWTKAKASFDKAIKMQSPLPQAHYNLALMYMSAGKDFPGLDLVKAYEASIAEFNKYRSESGGKLAKDDPSVAYLEELNRQLEREKKRIEKEKERAAKAAAKGASGTAAKKEGANP